ncbi:MAG: DUF4982 domain-containing protein [Treponema sp.]|nr:DUF4982 domain-containing protein [Treponema sp.]
MKKLFCNDWVFSMTDTGKDIKDINSFDFKPVDLPHDWLIYDVNKLYETSLGWYKKNFKIDFEPQKSYRIYFEGVYQDCTVYVNSKTAFEWKYGYTSFEADITKYVKSGDNEIIVLARHFSPNSRWYSGAGIYRNVWFIETEKTYLDTDGVYFSAKKNGDVWNCSVRADVRGADFNSIKYKILDNNGKVFYDDYKYEFDLKIPKDKIWDIENPYLFNLRVDLYNNEKITDTVSCKIGFKDFNFDCDKGFFLNGRSLKLNGVCLHHDLGCLGAAFNKEAQRRQLLTMKEMGVNAVRTSHNPPAIEFMELCDEMGILVNSEAFDMWERSKTKYDYARFFNGWYKKDVASWIRRDRNHPCLIMWSIGNEIHDTHISERGCEVTKMLQEEVRRYDPRCNAFTTIGSNYMQWDNGQKCADEVDLAGYNYGEYLYEEHHNKHKKWKIYGSETTSGVKSRGVYHFPLERRFLTHEDLQCSSLGNCRSGFEKLGAEDVIVKNRDTQYCAGMFIWTGTDYIGEPTPYSTKNAYFGPVDTAGLKKDLFYLYKAAWTKEPVLHILPYWDFNIGQKIDIVVYTNLKEVELFKNGKSLGKKKTKNYTITWNTEYEEGTITAAAFNKQGQEIKTQKKSFLDSESIIMSTEKKHILADGKDLLAVEISALDKNGTPVENARNRISLTVEGARLLGFDNGDSSDYDQYKSSSRRLFSGKAVAYIASPIKAGEIIITAESPGLKSAVLKLEAKESKVQEGTSAVENVKKETDNNEIPVRKIELIKECPYRITPENKDVTVKAKVFPQNASRKDLNWSIVTASGVKTNNAQLSDNGLSVEMNVTGDGEFHLRCTCNNGKKNAEVVSEYEFRAEGFGQPILNPYDKIPACLYNIKTAQFAEVSNGGIQIAGEQRIAEFGSVDFGKYGSDEFEIFMIHWFTDESVKLKLYLNDPESKERELLGEYTYQANFIWQTYQANKYKIKKTLYGINNIFFEFGESVQKLDFGGFVFIPKEKAYQKIKAADYDTIHGDNFKISESKILDIGNNVFIEYHNMDFKDGASEIIVKGRTRHDNDPVHVHFEFESGETIREIIEFPRSKDYAEVSKKLVNVKGRAVVKFIFLPGCDFDFEEFVIKRAEHQCILL